MSTIYVPVRRRSSPSRPALIEQILLALLAGLLIFGLSIVLTFFGTRLWYAGRILPGVSVSGVDVGGLTPDQASIQLIKQISYPTMGKIVLRDKDRMWVVSPSELGMTLDPQATAREAFQVGRSGSIPQRVRDQINAAYAGQELAPIMVFDGSTALLYLQKIAKEIDHPAQEASLALNGTQVVVTPGQPGRQVNIADTLTLLELQMRKVQDGAITLFVRDSQPVILDASAEADMARKILSAPLTIDLPGPDAGKDGAPWVIPPDQLAQMITIEKADTPNGERYQVGLREELLRSFLSEVAPKLARSPANARFTFNDSTKQLEVIESAVIGRQIDADNSVKAIQDKLRAGEHQAALVISYTNPPAIDSTKGEDLGIRELVHTETSYFRGSSAARIQNIKAAAARFHGVLVAPGETFSMASAIGDITLDNGFAEALIIVGGQTITGVGGGVCQVSTTLFRGVFFAGYPIVQRYPHAYRVGYYEQTASGHDAKLAGLDATVFVPIVDFKFKNDSSNWLLMETYVNGYSLTWKFYSTSDGRRVEWNSSGPTNIVPAPDPIYRENPDLKSGEIKQVDYAAEGSDVTVDRTVYNQDGSVHLQDTVSTHYEAWQNVFEYGPGTDLPPKN